MDTKKSDTLGHSVALLTATIWGTTFISTKVLLNTFTPIEILFVRFLLGFAALLLLYPKRLKTTNYRQELLLAAAGISGITFYYLLENIALTITTASNVGIILTVAPFFTALLSTFFLKTEKPTIQFYLGFLVAISGVALISYNGNQALELNPLGDLLALAAAAMWAIYSILIRKISGWGYHTILTTRRVFFYGLLCMLPLLFVLDFHLTLNQFSNLMSIGNLLFLGFGASALCFITWNTAVRLLGAVKSSIYIYLVPVITLATSVLILHEPLTPIVVTGALLTLIGSWLSETTLLKRYRYRKLR